jgi:hypothetical protein
MIVRTIADSKQIVFDGLKEEGLFPDGHARLNESEENLTLGQGDDVEDIGQQADGNS